MKINPRIFNSIDRNIANIIEVFQAMSLLLMIILVTMAVSAIAYTMWESAIGHWAFHVSRETFPIVGAIGLCAIQLHDLVRGRRS